MLRMCTGSGKLGLVRNSKRMAVCDKSPGKCLLLDCRKKWRGMNFNHMKHAMERTICVYLHLAQNILHVMDNVYGLDEKCGKMFPSII